MKIEENRKFSELLGKEIIEIAKKAISKKTEYWTGRRSEKNKSIIAIKQELSTFSVYTLLYTLVLHEEVTVIGIQ